MAMTLTQKTDMYRFFAIAFDAAPGVTYMEQLGSALAGGMTTKDVVNEFTTKAVFTAIYPNFLDNATFAAKLVDNVVGASASAAAKAEAVADITGALDAGWSRGDVIYQVFGNLAEKPQDDATWGGTATQMANQVTVAAYYTETLLKASTDTATLQAVIANVTNTTDVSTTAAIEAAMPGSVTAGTNFTLTNSANQTTGGADNYTGTSGADTFLATADGALDNGDVVNGGDGTDTLTARYSLANDKTVNVAVTNVENISIDLDDGDTLNNETLTFSASGMTGLQNITVIDAASTLGQEDIVNVTNIAAGVVVGITNGDANWQGKFDYASTTGTADTATLKLTAAKADLVTIDGIETLTVNAVSGTSTLDKLTAAAATKLVITGAGKLTVSDLDNTNNTVLDEFDASVATGNVKLVGMITGDVSIAGGTGNDTFNLAAGLATTDTISGGDGTDRVIVSASLTTVMTDVTGIEEVELAVVDINDAGTATLSGAAVVGATNFVINSNTAADNDDATVAVTNLVSGDTITVTSAGGDSTSLADGVALTGTLATDGIADSLTLVLSGIGAVTADVTNKTGISEVTFDTVETLAITANANSGGTVTTNEVEKLSADALKTLTVTGAGSLTLQDIDNTTALTSIDASAATGKFSITGLDASALNFKAGSAQTTVSMGGLNATDTITGGASTKDALTATGVTGLTATTGKLNVTGFETVKIQATAANTIDASLMTGLTTLSFSGATPGNQTVTNLAAGVAIGVGDSTSVFDNDATLSVALADATGTADSLTFKIDNSASANTDVALKVSSVESVTLAFLAGTDGNANDTVFNLSAVKAATITVTGGLAATTLTADGGTDELYASTTTFDASGFLGNVLIDRASAATDVGTIKVSGGATAAHTIQGSDSTNDTVTVGSSTDSRGNVADVIAGGTAKSDSLTMYVNSGFVSVANVSEFEDITLNVKAGDDVTITNVAGFNDAELNNITVLGGNELSTLKITTAVGAATTETIDASSFGGNIGILLSETAIDAAATVTIKGGALATDIVAVTTTNSATEAFNTTGIEEIAVLEATNASTIDFANAVGVTLLSLDSDKALTLNNLASTVVVRAGLSAAAAAYLTAVDGVDTTTIDINYASTSGAADSMTLNLADTKGAAVFDIDGIETINIAAVKDEAGAWDTAHDFSLAGSVNATNKIAVVMTGGDASSTITFAAGGLVSDVTSLNASTLASAVVISAAARMSSSAMTITGGTAGDTIAMENTADVLDGGTGTDTLVLTQNAVLGGFAIDLSSTVDQITTYNGSANSAVQKGFEKVDLSSVTGAFGADVTAISTGSTITGTINGDVITGGAGVDVIVGGAGNDAITAGAGVDDITIDALRATGQDTLVFTAAQSFVVAGGALTSADTIRTIDGAVTTGSLFTIDTNVTATTLSLLTNTAPTLGTTTVLNAGDFLVNVISPTSAVVYQDSDGDGKISANDFAVALVGSADITRSDFTVSGGNLVFTGTAGGGAEDTRTGTTGNDTLDLGASSLNILLNYAQDPGNDTLTTGTGDDTVNSGSGDDTITTNAGNDSVTGGDGNDTINTVTGDDTIFGGAGNDIITGGTGNDVITGGAGNDNITSGTDADIISYSVLGQGGNTTAAAATPLTVGDNIVSFETTVDDIRILADVGSTNAATSGVAGAWNLSSNAVYIVTGTTFEFTGGVTAYSVVSTAIGNITADSGDAAYIAFRNAAGTAYNLFEVVTGGARNAAVVTADVDTISHVAIIGMNDVLVAGDFIFA